MKSLRFVLLAAAVMAPPLPALAADGASAASYTRFPLSFEVNRGQTAPEVRFLARGQGYTLFLTADETWRGTPTRPTSR